MSRRAGSSTPYLLGFLVLALIAIAGNWRLDVMRRAGRHTATVINNDIRLAEQSLAELRGTQAGYLAPGQKPDDWMNKATGVSTQLESAIASLTSATASPDARQHYESAAALVGELTANDRKARALITSGQELIASDVLFQEGAEPARKLTTELFVAREIEMAAFEKSAVSLGWMSLGANGAVFAIGLLLMFLGMRSAKSDTGAADESQDGGIDLRSAPAAPAASSTTSPTAGDASGDLFAASTVDLSGAADLCVDLGRILDGRDLQGLMARAASVLEAKGLVLWVSEAGGSVLRPSVAHGYSDRVLQRMGTLPADGDNVTSLAFRTLQPQVLRSSFDGHGALAVPLITSAGCVGVLAAEVQGAKPGDVRFAVARIVAAQLSTLVGPGTAIPAQSASGLN